ncbi:MAG: glycosyltransferase family 39 protein [Candidatus Fermentibacteraceae bacterium]|nr:glycosyltransferase family 39 protein [Candidatus Fermentibacteraceae bacterium]
MQRKRLEPYIFLLALLARLAVFFLAVSGFFLVGEGQVQADLAENIVSGRGFMLSESMFHDSDPRRDASLEFFRETGGFYGVLLPEKPTAFLVPGFALFEALIFAVAGLGNLTAVVGVQLVLGLLTVFLGMRIASRFLSGWWYTAAGVFIALDPFELYFQAVPATQALFSLLFVAGLLFSLRYLEKPRITNGVVAGLVWGVTFLVRPAALPMVAWLAVMVLAAGKFSIRLLPSILVMLASFAVVLTPWVLRNRNTMGRYQLLPLQGGVQMWEYNGRIFTDAFLDEAEGARLLYGPVRQFWLPRLNQAELAEFPAFTTETEFQRDSVLYSRQSSFLKANPLVFLHLSACRFAEFFKPFPLNRFSPVHTMLGLLSFFWVGVFFFAGMLLLIRTGRVGVYTAGVIAGYILMHLLTASGTPHRVALDVPLIIASLVAVKYSFERFRAGKSSL